MQLNATTVREVLSRCFRLNTKEVKLEGTIVHNYVPTITNATDYSNDYRVESIWAFTANGIVPIAVTHSNAEYLKKSQQTVGWNGRIESAIRNYELPLMNSVPPDTFFILRHLDWQQWDNCWDLRDAADTWTLFKWDSKEAAKFIAEATAQEDARWANFF